MQDYSDSHQDFTSASPRRRPSMMLWGVLGCAGLVVIVVCGGGLGWLVMMGTYGPDTSVYTGNQVPTRFLETAKSVGALDEDEKIVYFYSDAMTDIRDGFYFVSNKRVVIYSQSVGTPLVVVPFQEIADVELFRDESFFEDSEITIHLNDGQVVSFPVSSEYDRDEDFYHAIRRRAPAVSESAESE